jgi:precorrin-3B synthase
MKEATLVKGWCPGALRPMETGDGLLVRVRPPGGALSLSGARGLAALARAHGSGAIDLSGSGNPQLRGVRPEALSALQGGLAALGLLDADAAGEAVRNIVASPLSDLDPTALVDVRPLAAALAARLVASETLRRLPAKFRWSIEDGGAFPLGDVGADVGFRAARMAEEPKLVVEIAKADGMIAIGTCAPTPQAVADTAEAVAGLFLALRSAPRRMRLATPMERCDIAQGARLSGGKATAGAAAARFVGALAVQGRVVAVGVGLPFGRMTADDLDALADAAERAGATDLRPTIQRAVLVPGASTLDFGGAAPPFLLSPDDPRARVVACTGAPGCSSALMPTLPLAVEIAALHPAARVHVSGCAKGCAHRKPAPLTLVGHADGVAVVHAGGPADAPREILPLGALAARLPALIGDLPRA